MSIQDIMSSIDAIKHKLSDGEYKELCDKMMALNNKERLVNDNIKIPVKIWFQSVNVDTKMLSSGTIHHYYDLKRETRIVMMTKTQFDGIKFCIENQANHIAEFDFNKPYMVDLFEHPEINVFNKTKIVCNCEDDCDCNDDIISHCKITPNEPYTVYVYHAEIWDTQQEAEAHAQRTINVRDTINALS